MILYVFILKILIFTAPNANSIDIAWFWKMIENNLQSNVGNTDDYGHAIVKNINFHKRYFFERV